MNGIKYDFETVELMLDTYYAERLASMKKNNHCVLGDFVNHV